MGGASAKMGGTTEWGISGAWDLLNDGTNGVGVGGGGNLLSWGVILK